MEGQISEFCEKHFVGFVLNPNEENLSHQNAEISEIDPSKIPFCSRPISTALSQATFRKFVLFAACILSIDAAINLSHVFKSSYVIARLFRISHPQEFNHSQHDLILLENGCKLDPQFISMNLSSALNFKSSTRVSGYCVIASHGSSISDPRTLTLQYSNDGVLWADVLQPPWLSQLQLQSVSIDGLSCKAINMQAPWQWLLRWCGGEFLLAAGFLVSSILGMSRQESWGHSTLTAAYFLFSCTHSVAALTSLLPIGIDGAVRSSLNQNFESIGGSGALPIGGPSAATINCWLMSVLAMLLTVAVAVERFAIDTVPLLALLLSGSVLADRISQADSPAWPIATALAAAWSGLPALAAILGAAARSVTARRAARCSRLRQDRRAFDDLWRRTLAADSRDGQLRAIALAAVRLAAAAPRLPAMRQEIPSQLADSATAVGPGQNLAQKWGWAHWHRWSRRQPASRPMAVPVKDLDQLCAAAAALDICLRHKVLALAAVSGGLLPAARRGSGSGSPLSPVGSGFSPAAAPKAEAPKAKFLTAEEALSCPGGGRGLWGAAPKPAERVLSKLRRCYGSDPARLLDCCRQTLVFECAADLRRCLEAMGADAELDVVGVRNRLEPGSDAAATAGYRSATLPRAGGPRCRCACCSSGLCAAADGRVTARGNPG